MNASGKRVIINADDFGLSTAVNEAVLHAAEDGLISSATIMANMPGFEEAVRGALAHPHLGVGVHLNLLRGKALSDPAAIPSLVDQDGNLPGSAGALARKILMGKLLSSEIEAEICAQIRRVLDCGIVPTHLDSEKHMHLAFPLVGAAACRAASAFGIPSIRVAREMTVRPACTKAPGVTQRLKSAFIRRQSHVFVKTASDHGLRFTDAFFGIAYTGLMTAPVYMSIFSQLPEGTVEIMTHPAKSAGAAALAGERSWLDRQRVAEYRALLDREAIGALAANRIALITYADL
jgi:predicted glycoside hydrolase/deacetylase ChbG (UPF0249 family)